MGEVTARARLVAAAALACSLVAALPASAQTPVESFEQARQAYLRGEFDEVVRRLDPLVGGPMPMIRDRVLVRESRKYLGAAYVLTGREPLAEDQFRELLVALGDGLATYELEPAALFPQVVQTVFRRVRGRLVQEREDAESRRAAEAAEREAERREALLTLLALAQVHEVEVPHDAALAWIPFGVGQFQNGNPTLGAFFLVSEAVTLTGAAVLAAWTIAYEASRPTAVIDRGIQRGLHVANWVSLGAFGVLAIAGVAEAHINFVPSRTVRREREVPPDVLESLELTLGPGTIGLRGTF